MAWPPTPLPINFTNATVSLDTHPQAHNATNLQLNNDIVPEINTIRTGLPAAPGTFTPTMTIAGVNVTLYQTATRWTRNYNMATAWAQSTIQSIIGTPTGEAAFGFTSGPPGMVAAGEQPVGTLAWFDTDFTGFQPPCTLIWATSTTFYAVKPDGNILNTTFSPGDRFRWTISYIT